MKGLRITRHYLIQQAKIYLLVDTKKALTTIEIVKVEVPTDHLIKPTIDELAEAYSINKLGQPSQRLSSTF